MTNYVCREELWGAMQRYGVSGDLVRTMKVMYQASKACVRVDGYEDMRVDVRVV